MTRQRIEDIIRPVAEELPFVDWRDNSIDGVDLNLLKPQQAIDRADDVGKTFWKYSQLVLEGQVGSIRKIGVVLNGLSHLKPREHDAHDYALHRLKAEADTAIDAASTEATATLERELQAIG